MSKLWAIIQAHLDEYGVREAAFARRMGTSPQTLSSWKHRGLKQLPERWLLEAVAREARTTYEAVLEAVLDDIGYGGGEDDQRSAPIATDVSKAVEPAGGAPGAAAGSGAQEGSEPTPPGIQWSPSPRRKPTRGKRARGHRDEGTSGTRGTGG